MMSKLIGGTSKQRQLQQEVAEFRVLKREINKARCIVELNADGVITHANENLCRVLGYQASELLGKQHSRFVPAADADSQAMKQFWQELNAGNSQAGEFKLLGKAGNTVWLQGYYAPVCEGSDNHLRKVVAYLTDITATKDAYISTTSEVAGINSVFAIATFDLDKKIIDINEAFYKTLGFDEQELLGQPATILLTEEDKANHSDDQYWDTLKQGQSVSRQVRRKSKDGRSLWFLASFFPIKGASGQVEKIKQYCVCITDEKSKNANYESQINAFHKLQGVIEFDLYGSITSINGNFQKATGYSAEEVIGKHHSIFLDEQYKNSPEYKLFWEQLRAGQGQDGVFQRFGKGGKEIWLRAYYYPVSDIDGKAYKVVKFATDITAEIVARQERETRAAHALMIQTTLDSASTNMMMADNDGIIRYMNESAHHLMQNSASNLRQELPHFNPEQIIGQNFDIFHKNPAHQRNLLASLTNDYTTDIHVGELFLRLKATPIFGKDGQRAGTSLEWQDITQERKVSEQIATIIANAASGDLAERIDLADKTGTTVEICSGVNNLLDKITEVLLKVREAGETINVAAQEIASGNNDLSSRTEQQASSLEETASSMEELASTVKQNADNAKQANQMAGAASQVAIRGGNVVGNVVTTMNAMNESARKIEDIITVIDGIAFQTNILALNAAVEAARAGEQGRGFAVVAGEVRSLAQRSASAAKEIKELITDSVSKTAEGTKLVQSAGETMQEIVTSVQRVTDIMGEITAASTEQSSGIDQVNQAVTNMDEVTQQNAALVEEAAAAAESLVEQASGLMETVNQFKLRGAQRSIRAAQPPSVKKSKPVARDVQAELAHSVQTARTGTDNQGWEEF
ncbi:methyl-accepting chemotaxis protein [Methylophilus rhizosphaerae]|nr:methyl-accepting chemotaxis protein [Methylophilus rhizosphaerae]